MKIIKSKIKSVNLHPYINYINRDDHKINFVAEPGINHYYLLSYLASKISNGLIIELGTHHGTSCLALTTNKSNTVITYDVRDLFGLSIIPENLTRKIGNIFELNEQAKLLTADLIFLDTAHTGDFERQVYSYLVDNNYKGILLLDDIHWNQPMKDFWNDIDTVKYDITDIGHGQCPNGAAGTGIVDFSGLIVLEN